MKMDITGERQQILARMRKLEDYFQEHAAHNELFVSEFNCARAVRQVIEHRSSTLNNDEVQEIVRICNDTYAVPHYNGSAWMDYQLHLKHLLAVDNFNLDLKQLNGKDEACDKWRRP